MNPISHLPILGLGEEIPVSATGRMRKMMSTSSTKSHVKLKMMMIGMLPMIGLKRKMKMTLTSMLT